MNDDFYGDKFRWFTGVVKDIGDDRSRVRVRIFGIHHTEDLSKVSDGDLPWAMVLYPTTGGQGSGGNASHGLVPGTWVVGFFVDGEDSQQPIIMGVINGGSGSVNSSPADITPNVSVPGVSNPGTTPSSSTYNDSPTTQLEGNGSQARTYNYFWQKISSQGGYTGDLKNLCAAMIGNFNIESNCNPQAYNPNDKGLPAMGIAQWRDVRLPKFLSFCGVNVDTKPPNLPPLEKQLDYVWLELNTSEKKAYNRLISSQNIQDSVAAMIYYERDASYRKIQGVWTVDRSSPYYLKKLNAAKQAYSKFTYTGTSNSGTTTTGRGDR